MTLHELTRLINRHMARCLGELEEAGCPIVFCDAVKHAFRWLKDDVKETDANERTML